MAEQDFTVVDDAGEVDEAQGRQRSTIGFPYVDLKSAITLVQAIHGNVGLGECDDLQLAAWTTQSARSSTFRNQLSGTRMFGLMSTDTGSKHRLTDLGRMIVDPARSKDAKARAFMNVPLYRAIYDSYKEGVLPPAAALARDMVGLGVAEKTKDRARQLFERSAEQAGFFAHGRNRLVMPAIVLREETSSAAKSEPENNRGMPRGDGRAGADDPIIRGLLARLPEVGEIWPESGRALWLELLKGSFKLIYKDKPDDGRSSP